MKTKEAVLNQIAGIRTPNFGAQRKKSAPMPKNHYKEWTIMASAQNGIRFANTHMSYFSVAHPLHARDSVPKYPGPGKTRAYGPQELAGSFREFAPGWRRDLRD